MADMDHEPIIEEQTDEEPQAAQEKKRRSRLPSIMIILVAVAFCVYAVIDIVQQQDEIEQLEQETQIMSAKIEQAKQLGDEYEQLLSSDEEEFMERIAVEQLGYAYPNEKRFYIVTAED